jgi:hypothetical protein
MNAMTDTQRENFRTRSNAAENPTIVLEGGRYFEGAFGLERMLDPGRPLSLHDVTEIDRQLAAGERQYVERKARRLPEQPAYDPDAPLTVREQMNEQLFAETRKAAEFRATDAGRLERLIELNERILEALEKGQPR